MKEAEFAKRIEETANFFQLRWHHETDSRKSKAGFPDYCMVGPRGVLFLEIKADKGKVSPQQEAWINALSSAMWDDSGVDQSCVLAYVAYPKDWNRVLADMKRISGR